MCELRAFLEARLAATLSCEVISFSPEAMRELLDRCRCGVPGSPADCGDAAVVGTPTAWRVKELAPKVGCAESTLRALLAGGLLGDPEPLKPNGKSFAVPRSLAQPLLDHVRAGGTVQDYRLSPLAAGPDAAAPGDSPRAARPASAPPVSSSEPLPVPVAVARETPPASVARRPAASRRQPSRARAAASHDEDLGGWRSHYPRRRAR